MDERWPVPEEIPGVLVDVGTNLIRKLCDYCGQKDLRFPGSQPVSFSTASLGTIKSQDFWVCEKSDGIRVLMFVHTYDDSRNNVRQDTYLIGRKNDWHLLADTNFHAGKEILQDSVFDAELVIDVIGEKQNLNLYIFDEIALNGKSYSTAPFEKRYSRMRDYITFHKHAVVHHPEYNRNLVFGLKVKEQRSAYRLNDILATVPTLTHGNDGLIFTNRFSPYIPGTDPNIIKWKPAEENSIDVLLRLKFPPNPNDPNQADFSQTPVIFLYTNGGSARGHVFLDGMVMSDDEWAKWRNSCIQLDDRIGEVAWSPDRNDWRLLRLREDKSEPNFVRVAESILKSIEDSVSAQDLISNTKKMELAHKYREKRQEYVRKLEDVYQESDDDNDVILSAIPPTSVIHSLAL